MRQVVCIGSVVLVLVLSWAYTAGGRGQEVRRGKSRKYSAASCISRVHAPRELALASTATAAQITIEPRAADTCGRSQSKLVGRLVDAVAEKKRFRFRRRAFPDRQRPNRCRACQKLLPPAPALGHRHGHKKKGTIQKKDTKKNAKKKGGSPPRRCTPRPPPPA